MPSKDFTTDPSPTFIPLLKEAGALPAWIEPLLSAVPDEKDCEKLASMAFADTNNRLFPMHTKAATFLSAVSAYVYGHPSGVWEERLKAACHAYDISSDVKAAHAALRPPSKEASAEQAPVRKYAMEVILQAGAAPSNFYPITTASQVEDSAIKMARDIEQKKLPPSWFSEGAEALMKAAAEHGVASYLIPDVVSRLAEARLPSPSILQQQLDKRAAAGVDADGIHLYKEAVEGVLSGEMCAMDGAHFWEMADRRYGIKYAGSIHTPVEAFRSGRLVSDLEKEAAATVMVHDVLVPFPQLQTLPDRLVASVMEKEAAAVILQAMNAPDGLQATEKLASLTQQDQAALLEMLVSSADGVAVTA